MARIRVVLTPQEVSFANGVGVRRNREDIEYGHPAGGGFVAFGDNGDKQNSLGAVGELVVAKRLGIPWAPASMKQVDIGGYQVRTTSLANGRLIIRERDKGSEKFVLVVKMSETEYDICGWIEGDAARKVGRLMNPRSGSRLGSAWFVDQKHLHPFV